MVHGTKRLILGVVVGFLDGRSARTNANGFRRIHLLAIKVDVRAAEAFQLFKNWLKNHVVLSTTSLVVLQIDSTKDKGVLAMQLCDNLFKQGRRFISFNTLWYETQQFFVAKLHVKNKI